MKTMPVVTKQQLLNHYRTQQAAADALGVTRQLVSWWPDGPLQEKYALKLAFVIAPKVFGRKQ